MIRDTYAVIDLDALEHNLSQIKNEVPLDRIYAVVKANAYGHGLTVFTQSLYELGIRNFAVATLSEAVTLLRDVPEIIRESTLLIMGYTPDRFLMEYREYPFVFTIFSLEQAMILSDSSVPVRIEIKVNTGFNRLGKRPTEDFADEVTRIRRLKNIVVHGIFSHLRLADREEDLRQINDFESFCLSLPFSDYRKHICDSIGFVQYPQARFDMVRLGAVLYGLVPDRQLGLGYRPVLSLYSEISNVIQVRSGEGISYDEQFAAPKDMTVAVLPIGYGDGFKRSLSNNGSIHLNGRSFPIVSTICMDQLTVDITGSDARPGDTAELIGPHIPVRMVASAARTNRNDITASLSSRIERRYVKNGAVVRVV